MSQVHRAASQAQDVEEAGAPAAASPSHTPVSPKQRPPRWVLLPLMQAGAPTAKAGEKATHPGTPAPQHPGTRVCVTPGSAQWAPLQEPGWEGGGPPGLRNPLIREPTGLPKGSVRLTSGKAPQHLNAVSPTLPECPPVTISLSFQASLASAVGGPRVDQTVVKEKAGSENTPQQQLLT